MYSTTIGTHWRTTRQRRKGFNDQEALCFGAMSLSRPLCRSCLEHWTEAHKGLHAYSSHGSCTSFGPAGLPGQVQACRPAFTPTRLPVVICLAY